MEMNIFIQGIDGHDKFRTSFKPNDTIKTVKEAIFYRLAILPERQILLLKSINGRKELDDRITLKDYNINNDDTIYFSIKRARCDHKTIYVNINGEKTKITICMCGNVMNIKKGIQEKLGIKPEFQELSFNGKLLNDESIQIYTLGLKQFSVIDLKIKIRENLENDDNCDFKEKYKNELILLKNMGFNDEDNNIQALKLGSGNIQNAIELLVSMYN